MASARSAALFETNGLTLTQWDKARTDRVTVGDTRGQAAIDGEQTVEGRGLRLALADEGEAVA